MDLPVGEWFVFTNKVTPTCRPSSADCRRCDALRAAALRQFSHGRSEEREGSTSVDDCQVQWQCNRP